MIERTNAEIRQHRAEIDRIKQRWFDQEISVTEKRRLIREANLFFYGDRTTVIHTRHLVAVTDGAEPASPPWEDDEPAEMWWKKYG